MNSEHRIIRPFRDMQSAQGWMDRTLKCRLLHGDERIVDLSPGETARMDANVLRGSTVQVVADGGWGGLRKALLEDLGQMSDLRESQIILVFAVRTSYLKRLEVVKMLHPTEIGHQSEVIRLESTLFRAVHHGWRLDVLLALGEELRYRPGLPWRKGSWLARARFEVADPLEGMGFTPRPLTDEIREAYGLPADATRYIRIIDDQTILECTALDELLEYYVDEQLLSRLSNDPTSDPSRLEQTRIFLDAASFLIRKAHSEDGFEESRLDDVDGTVIDKFLRYLAGDEAEGRRRWLTAWKNDPERVLAAVESQTGLAKLLNRQLASAQ